MRIDAAFRALLADIIKDHRESVASELRVRLGRPVTKAMLDEYTRNPSTGREMRFPAVWVPAICQITGDDRLQRLLLGERLAEILEVGNSY